MHTGLLTGIWVTHLRPLAKKITILFEVVGLLAFSLLSNCASPEVTPNTETRATAAVKTQSTPWKLMWGDDFHGPAGSPPDQSKWTSDIGGNGWGDKQLEYNTDNKNAYQDGKGNLILEARQENPDNLKCWYGPCRYTSARITTRGLFNFTYGLLLARIKIPSGQGIWPAFWLLGSNYEKVGWPACGEIDVMENVGKKEPATIHGSTHGPENFTRPYVLPHGTFADDYHTFGVEWEPNRLSFIMDDIDYATLNRSTLTKPQNWVYDHPFDIILDLSIGGPWPGNPDSTTTFPQQMYVSYVNLYTKK